MEDSTSIRDRFRFKRATAVSGDGNSNGAASKVSSRGRPRLNNHAAGRLSRKSILSSIPCLRGKPLLYGLVLIAVVVYAVGSVVMQSSIAESVWRKGERRWRGGKGLREGLRLGSGLRFVTQKRFLDEERGLDRARKHGRVGVRPPRMALILGNMKINSHSLMLFTVVNNLRKLGYVFTIHSKETGEAHSIWKNVATRILFLTPETNRQVDWSIFEGVIVDSIEAKEVVSSLMQEPFCSVPLIWIIHEDTLAKRLWYYETMGWTYLLSHWRSALSRADVVIFSDFSLPLLHSALDTGNFLVIPGSPAEVWSTEQYKKTHSKYQVREDNGIPREDLVVVIIGSSFSYNGLSLDHAMAMHSIGPLLLKYARKGDGGSCKFAFLGGNSTDEYDHALQDVSSHLGLAPGSVLHFGMNVDVSSVLIMADIVVYGPYQDEQGFPPLLIRAMTLGIPIIVPDTEIMRKYVVDGVHAMYFSKHDPKALMSVFSQLILNGELSESAIKVASSGKLLAKDILASECVTTYAQLLESVLDFPSDITLPNSVSQRQLLTWEWDAFGDPKNEDGIEKLDQDDFPTRASIVYILEEELTDEAGPKNVTENHRQIVKDFPTRQDWETLQQMEEVEEFKTVEMEELKERMEKDLESWNDIYRNARKSEKLSFEANERDEGELERTGQPVCVYEIYGATGAWPFLHHGSLYRGLSLTTKSRRLRSDDVDAATRLNFLNGTYYRELLCEVGGMFSLAHKIDEIHMRPWIGFQSWRAAGQQVSLSSRAESVLEQVIKDETKGDVLYFWARLDMDGGVSRSSDVLTFWSMCDMLNGGRCRDSFDLAFRKMYDMPSQIDALPPMPEDGGYWSTSHSWVMPTPSFLEFMMFTRMFVDSLDSFYQNASAVNDCLLGSSKVEKRHCYCRVLELLVNVWAYHSARKMVYLDPRTGILTEQHPLELRRGFMWPKYFNFTLLKSMDEDLAESADDGDFPRDPWLWPMTGEVHWQGIYEREREERYRAKMDKKRKIKEKLNDRMKHGYKQKSLGG
ncbi:hypothetical protein MLD38_008613 [Melastoma candidum]|uniref:Uncharacterized protein n=2 Tax=Melastoma candidum TaxID=119954 RepID=A0ACB9RUK8_9MYRT|nr:hypothetical protein MLD38_008613 [Melastoma candidum]